MRLLVDAEGLWGARISSACGCQFSIRLRESSERQTSTAECRQSSASPLTRKQMVVGLKRKRLGVLPSPP